MNYCMAAGKNISLICARVKKSAESAWIHSPYNAHWNAKTHPVFVDDFAWYSLAFLRLFEWTNDTDWLERAAGLQDWAWEYGWDYRSVGNGSTEAGVCGGFWWNLMPDKRYKDSISIVEVLFSAAKLASIPAVPSANRTRFLNNAEKIWSWLFAFDDGRGLLAPNGIMSTGATPEWCCNSKAGAAFSNFTLPGPKCVNSQIPGMSYNHGLLMSSAALLYNLTKDEDYLNAGLDLLDSAVANLTDAEGAVQDVQRGSRFATAYECSARTDPGSDFFSFKGIFVAHLSYFAETLWKSNALSPDAHTKLLSMVAKSSNNAWQRSAVFPPFKKIVDVCSYEYSEDHSQNVDDENLLDPSVNITFPKFHWWWSANNASIETPPDTRIWFTNGEIRCTYGVPHANSNTTTNSSKLVMWSGYAKTPDVCRARCSQNTSCVKYLFRSSTSSEACPCYTCQHKPCEPPDCVYCTLLKLKACPHKNSTGCYTTNSYACDCTTLMPGPPNANCWLYGPIVSVNRSHGEACSVWDTGYYMGIKRPPSPVLSSPWTTCVNRCGNQTVDEDFRSAEGAPACHCDSACARHMDCCLDYVDVCLPHEGQQPSCKGRCVDSEDIQSTTAVSYPPAVPIKGGGYCYCHSTCYNVYTDNNSYGSCCGDHDWQCNSALKDPVCFDARTQAQALHLFVAHYVLQNATIVDDKT